MTNYKSPFLFSSGHIDTLVPFLLRKKKEQPYVRERLILDDGDFLDLDWIRQDSKKLVILSHGLESSTDAKYILGMADIFKNNRFDVLAWNSRGCSGVINDAPHCYHSGMSQDLNSVVNHVLKSEYQEVYLIGFSMGGNITLKYLGEQSLALDPRVKKACVFSTPVDLGDASNRLASGFSKIYTGRFLKTLREKVIQKKNQFPESKIDLNKLKSAKNLVAFDDFFTAPMFGFKSSKEYYYEMSSKRFLDDISVPTLIVNALNDPFLAEGCFPYEASKRNKNLYLETPKAGGHCGFFEFNGENILWSEKRALAFMTKYEEKIC